MKIKNAKVVHFMPGRVRLRVKELKNMPELVREVQSAFEGIPGVDRVDVNRLTGSVLIEYDTHIIQSAEARDALSKVLTTYFPTLPIPKLLSWLAKSPQSF